MTRTRTKKRSTHRLRRLLCTLAAVCAILLCAGLVLNFRVIARSKPAIVAAAAAAKADCIIVFGAGVYSDGSLTAMLADRMDVAIALYQAGVAPKLLLSGDHGRTDYDEVGCMRKYALDAGVADADIFLDHAGFSTYETLFRAQAIFGVHAAVLVTQTYHLYRAVYIAQELGLSTQGVGSDPQEYAGQWQREAREIAARIKDTFSCLFRPEPTYLGEAIPIIGDGRITWDDTTAV